MKLKLTESATPISKLQHNIENNILPEFDLYEFVFNTSPTKPNAYKFIYNGSNVAYRCPARLELNTTNNEIEVFNSMEDKPYVGDLFATVYLNSTPVQLGVISSKDPSSVKYALKDVDFDEIIKPETKVKEEKVIQAYTYDMEYPPRTAKEWDELKNKFEEALKSVDPNSNNFQDKIKYQYYTKKYNYFMKNIYPLDKESKNR